MVATTNLFASLGLDNNKEFGRGIYFLLVFLSCYVFSLYRFGMGGGTWDEEIKEAMTG
jgi:hypothetical protein